MRLQRRRLQGGAGDSQDRVVVLTSTLALMALE
jgi:hypothetical protein